MGRIKTVPREVLKAWCVTSDGGLIPLRYRFSTDDWIGTADRTCSTGHVMALDDTGCVSLVTLKFQATLASGDQIQVGPH